MPQETIYRTICQYSRLPIEAEDVKRLLDIAEDCRKVRNCVYERYGGVGGLAKIYPGYTAQNEMTKSGLREKLGLPSVYFYSAVFDALGDIKSQWTRTRKKIETNIRANENLTPEDRHYLRFVLKQSKCFEAVLNDREPSLTEGWEARYRDVCETVDKRRLDQYLRRQVRRHLVRPHTDRADGFSVSPKGYRYGDHGIYLSMKESRKRLFVLLTDNNSYAKQIYLRLYPEEKRLTIHVPVEVKQKHPPGYSGELGLAMGMRCMFVTDKGAVYGDEYLEYQSALTDYVRERLPRHRKNAEKNPGTKKYRAGKARREAALHAYVNAEINRLLETEKPTVLYLPRLPGTSKAGVNKKINAAVSMWQKGYIKNRLLQKCREYSIEVVEVFGKGISTECCSCGAEGRKEGDRFLCMACGLDLPERQNAAGNALKRGQNVHYERIHR